VADADLLIKVGTTPKDPFEDVKESLKDVESKSGGVTAGFGKIAGALAGVAAVAGAFDFILDATRETEDLTNQFVRFTGSVESAAEQLDKLKDIEGPSLSELAEANRTLFSFGVSAKQSIDQMKSLADIATGSGAKVGELAEIFGKIQFEGNLTAETFSKLQKQVPGLAKDIAASLDIPEKSLKRLAASGELSSTQILTALQKMSSEGGRYFGAADTSTKGLSGSIGELQVNAGKLAAEIGTTLTPTLTSLANSLGSATEGMTKFIREATQSGNLTENQKALRSYTYQLEVLQQQLEDIDQDKRPVGALLDKLFGINKGQAMNDTINRINALKEAIEPLAKIERDLANSKDLAEAEAEKQRIRDKAAEDRESKLQAAAAAQAEIEAKAAEDRKKKLLETEKQINDLKAAEQSVGLQREMLLIEQNSERRAEIEKAEAAASLLREQEKAAGLFILRSEAELVDEAREAEANERRRVAQLEAVNARESEITAARAAAEASRQEVLGQFEQAEATRAQETQRKITETQRKAEADRLALIRKAQKEEFDLEAQKAQAQKQWDEQTYAQRLGTAQAGMNALSGLMKSKNREAFEVGKAAAIAQALVTIPATAIEAYKSLAGIPLVGPGLGAAAAAAAVVTGMEQVRSIQSQRLAFAEGGLVPGVGNRDTVPALLTPGEVVVPKNNYNDLKDSFVRGAVNDDQVMLLQAGNNIQMRILDTLTYGTVNEKLTSMLATLERVKDAIGNISLGSGLDTDKLKEANEEIEMQKPYVPYTGPGGGGQTGKRTINK
jgi:tape measure domain-containing protein